MPTWPFAVPQEPNLVGSLVAHAKLAYGAEHDLLELDRHPGSLLQLPLDGGHGLGRLDVNLDGSSARKVVRDHLDRRRLAATEPQNEVKSALLLDVVVRQRSPVLELLSGEDQTLLIGRDAFLVLNFGLDVLDGVGVL